MSAHQVFTTTFFFFIFLLPCPCSLSSEILSLGENYTNTIVSPGEIFELGFFRPVEEKPHWYLGIWYKKDPKRTCVWVANRENPLIGSVGILKLFDNKIILLDQDNARVWSTNVIGGGVRSEMVAQLLDNGNLVVKDSNNDSEGYLWQSFDYPTDTLIPQMKLGIDGKTVLKSWMRPNDPATGVFLFEIKDVIGIVAIYLTQTREMKKIRIYEWNGYRFGDMPGIMQLDETMSSFVMTNQLTSYSRLTIEPKGAYQIYKWIPEDTVWKLLWSSSLQDRCVAYQGDYPCTSYSYCSQNTSKPCNCMQGFNLRSGACVRKTDLNCSADQFFKLTNMKFPDYNGPRSRNSKEDSVQECEKICRINCECTAYAFGFWDIGSDRLNCLTWKGELKDMQNYTQGGQDLYVRLASKDIIIEEKPKKGNDVEIVLIIVGVGGTIIIIISCILGFYCWKRNTRNDASNMNQLAVTGQDRFKFMDFRSVAEATNHFSQSNELGKGGFGIVYKGILTNNQQVAVKRLSINRSAQGVKEFRNEVNMILSILHINLVQLVGCCCEGEEKILIYEFLENSSLNRYLFDESLREILNWERRLSIINGIAQGLLYLHKFTTPPIIHRDLKPSNVLLDKDMVPKISDFGLAKTLEFGITKAKTEKVVGTHGYMSKEYAMQSILSEKSDIFSFGVMLLEIITGRRNLEYCNLNRGDSLLDYAWRQYNQGNGLDLVDPNFVDSTLVEDQVLRCMKIALMCVQEHADDRPSTNAIVLMLGSATIEVPQPAKPNYFYARFLGDQAAASSSSSVAHQSKTATVNDATLSMMGGR